MNHLAHLRLSPPDPHWQIGALLGDFVRGHDLSEHPVDVRRGIELHRAIDAFTDAHPAFVASRRRIEGPLRRFSGVLVDVFYDHFLLCRFAELSQDANPTEFAQSIYAMLRDRRALLIGEISVHLDRMIENRWLEKAQDIPGVRAVLRRIEARSRRALGLEHGVEELVRGYERIGDDFGAFWPDVQAFSTVLMERMCTDT